MSKKRPLTFRGGGAGGGGGGGKYIVSTPTTQYLAYLKTSTHLPTLENWNVGQEKGRRLFPTTKVFQCSWVSQRVKRRGGGEATGSWVVLELLKHLFWLKITPFFLIRKCLKRDEWCSKPVSVYVTHLQASITSRDILTFVCQLLLSTKVVQRNEL